MFCPNRYALRRAFRISRSPHRKRTSFSHTRPRNNPPASKQRALLSDNKPGPPVSTRSPLSSRLSARSFRPTLFSPLRQCFARLMLVTRSALANKQSFLLGSTVPRGCIDRRAKTVLRDGRAYFSPPMPASEPGLGDSRSFLSIYRRKFYGDISTRERYNVSAGKLYWQTSTAIHRFSAHGASAARYKVEVSLLVYYRWRVVNYRLSGASLYFPG